MILIVIFLVFLALLMFNKDKFFNTNNPVKSLVSDNIYKKCKNLKVREDGLLCGDCLTSSGVNYIYSCNFCKLNNYGLKNGNLVCH
jgi:hypothetical protein